MSLDHASLKGVPMELRPRYYPKPPLRFKEIDIYIPLDALENDYDFTEERRVLAECKMWEDDKEKERLAEAERQRLLEEARLKLEEERVRLEEEEKQRKLEEQERLEKEAASLAASGEPTDQDSSSGERSKLELEEESKNNKCGGGGGGEDDSNPNSRESPSESENLANSEISQLHQHPQGLPSSDSETAVPHNGYHYISDSNRMPVSMYPYNHHPQHQHPGVASYYNYYGPPVPGSMPMPMGPQQQQHHQIQPQPPIIAPSGPGAPPVQYHPQSGLALSGSGSILQPQAIQPSPIPTTTTPQDSSSNQGGGGGTVSPAGSEHHSSTSQSARKVDLNLSDFESDTANPFDNVELKSINDMEVLASVLKNVPASNSHHSSSSAGGAGGAEQGSYANGSAPPAALPGYYHQPSPVYPPVSQPQSQQCPYPTWNQQNGFYSPTSVASTPAVVTSVAPQQHPVQQQQPPTTVVGSSHIPSPTQAIDPTNTPASVNSFTKLHFPFLTSMAASRNTRDRDNLSAYGGFPSAYNRSYLPGSGHHSTDDITSQNPFLSNYVQSAPPQPPRHPLSHSPLQQAQYWPSHLSHGQNLYGSTPPAQCTTPVSNGPVVSSSASDPTGANNFIKGPSAPPPGSQHALR